MRKTYAASSTTCPSCGQRLWGMVETCFKCGHPVDLGTKADAARQAERVEKEEKRRASFFYRWRFNSKFARYERLLTSGKARLFFAGKVGDERFAFGNTLMNRTVVDPSPVPTGSAWWALEEAGGVGLSLGCRRCGCEHLIGRRSGSGDLPGGLAYFSMRPIGDFSDHYQGQWSAPWFLLTRPVIAASYKTRDQLLCQSCGAETTPKIRRF